MASDALHIQYTMLMIRWMLAALHIVPNVQQLVLNVKQVGRVITKWVRLVEKIKRCFIKIYER